MSIETILSLEQCRTHYEQHLSQSPLYQQTPSGQIKERKERKGVRRKAEEVGEDISTSL